MKGTNATAIAVSLLIMGCAGLTPELKTEVKTKRSSKGKYTQSYDSKFTSYNHFLEEIINRLREGNGTAKSDGKKTNLDYEGLGISIVTEGRSRSYLINFKTEDGIGVDIYLDHDTEYPEIKEVRGRRKGKNIQENFEIFYHRGNLLLSESREIRSNGKVIEKKDGRGYMILDDADLLIFYDLASEIMDVINSSNLYFSPRNEKPTDYKRAELSKTADATEHWTPSYRRFLNQRRRSIAYENKRTNK